MRFFRIYYQVRGGHTHTRWFSGGSPNTTVGKCGELTFVNDEWEAMRTLLQHSTVEIYEEGEKPKAMR